MALDAQQILDRYKRGVQNGATNYQQGVTGAGQRWKERATSESAERNYASGVQRAVAQKKRQAKLQNVGAAAWEQAAKDVGAANYTRSANKAGENYNKVVQHVVAASQAAQNAADAMPGETIEQRLEKSRAASIETHRYWAGVNGVNADI